MMGSRIHVEMLGHFRLRMDDREITRFRTHKTGALLAYLALYKGRTHPRDLLIELFWPQSDLRAARTNLSVALNALRRQLEPPGVSQGAILFSDHAQVRLHPLAFTTDVEDFESTLREAETQTETEPRWALWMQAVDAYGGDLLPGYDEEWIWTERERLQDAYQRALRQTIKVLALGREYERAIEYAHRLVQMDPLLEEPHRNLMRLHAALGRPKEVLHQYQELERLLREAGQAAPSPQTQQLVQRLLSGKTAALWRPDEAARSAGEGRPAPPPPPSAPTIAHQAPSAERRPPSLPLQLTRFFGREEEIARLAHLLTPSQERVEGGSRLITLTGPGGTGKTRLAIEAARQVADAFPGGVWFVPLANLTDPLRLGETLRDALRLPPQTWPPALDQVTDLLNGREGPALLVLDNFEQISAGGAPVVWTLLRRIPSLRCLLTSRRRLALPGEREFSVPPLPKPEERLMQRPDPERLLACASVALFVDRAQVARPEFQITLRNAEAVGLLCARLEGLPLAIELAAARANALTPAQMLERLSERFTLLASRRAGKGDRHRSLWAVMEWSYHLLSPDLQRLFARLSVFRGGWSLEAAEVVCQTSGLLDSLAQLRSNSLLLAEESAVAIRFGMLETLREFAWEHLDMAERDAVRQRHLALFLMLAETAAPHLKGPEQTAWLEQLETEHDNLRAALQYSIEPERSTLSSLNEAGLRLANALCRFWEVRGHYAEGRGWLEAALAQPETQKRTPARALALRGAGLLAEKQGDYAAARTLCEESLAIERELGNRQGVAYSLNNLGIVAKKQGDYAAARALYEESLAMHRERGDQWAIAGALNNLGNVAQEQGDYAAARTLYEEALILNRTIGNRAWEAQSLNGLGNVAADQGDHAAARALYAEGLAIRRELGDKQGIAYSLNSLAALAREQGDSAQSRACLAECLTLCRELGNQYLAALALENLAALVHARQRFERAACLYGVATTLRESIGAALPPQNRKEVDPALSALRAALGEAAFATAFAAGRALGWEQAIAYAQEAAKDPDGKPL